VKRLHGRSLFGLRQALSSCEACVPCTKSHCIFCFHFHRTLVKRHARTGVVSFDGSVLAKLLEKRGVLPPPPPPKRAPVAADAVDGKADAEAGGSDAESAAESETSVSGQLLPADPVEYLQVSGRTTNMPRLRTPC